MGSTVPCDPRSTARTALGLAAFVACTSSVATAPAQQDLGHKTLGTLGLRAGAQVEPGVYLADRFVGYSAHEVYDRRGERLDVGLDLGAAAGAIGVKAVFRLPVLDTHWSLAIGVPAARVSARTERPEASVDRFGLGDVFLQPAQLGWRLPHLDVVTGYALYVPTGRFEPRTGGGISQGHVTHELSLGGALYFDRARTWHLSALAAYDLNQRKRGLDLTRGDTVRIQGGAGKRFLRIFEAGVVGYALFQVRDDRGEDLPVVLRGARDRAFGLGVEVNALIPPLRSQLSIRWAHDVSVRSRTLGQILVVGWTFVAWTPGRASPP